MASYRRTPTNPQYRQTQSRGIPQAAIAGQNISRPLHPDQRLTGISGSNLRGNNPPPLPSQQASRPPSRPQSTKKPLDGDELIVIHVCDENRQVNRDFKCRKAVLLNEMKYFAKHFNSNSSFDDIDISVHCDVQIFEWLMKYLEQENAPALEVNNVISILISSDFLQMQRLVDECIQFVWKNLGDVVNLPIDMSCLNENLLNKLAKLVAPEELENIRDRKDKLTSKLYCRKLDQVIKDEANLLNRCVYCCTLFTPVQRDWMTCDKAQIFIDFHGNVIAEHVPDRSFDINKFIVFLRQRNMPWRDIFWKIWGRLVSFSCTSCGTQFAASEINHCNYHPMEPKFALGSNVGQYQCCNQSAVRFDTSIKKKGCTATAHVISSSEQATPEYSILQSLRTLIEEPFQLAETGLIWHLKQFVTTECDPFESEDEPSSVESDNEPMTKVKAKGKKKAKGKEVNPTKQRIWNLDSLRMSDMQKMKNIKQNLVKYRKKSEQKSAAKANTGNTRPVSAPFKKK